MNSHPYWDSKYDTVGTEQSRDLRKKNVDKVSNSQKKTDPRIENMVKDLQTQGTDNYLNRNVSGKTSAVGDVSA